MGLAPFPRRILIPALAFAMASGMAAQGVAGAQAARAGESLGVDLYHSLAAGGGNVVFSPYSISETVAVLSAAAAGGTAQELVRSLHWMQAPELIGPAFEAQDGQLARMTGSDATLLVANGLWYQRGGEPRPAFLRTAAGPFGAEIRSADFIGDAPGVQGEINAWVGLKTLGKITNLIPEGALDATTRLALVNAVYFKGKWEHPFEARRTRPQPFFVQPETGVTVPQMSVQARLKVSFGPECGLLELPYQGGHLSMVILLPGERDGLPALEKSLDASRLLEQLAALDFATPRSVRVSLPRFRLSHATGLIPALTRLGVTAAFDPRAADFSAINGNRDLHVSALLHKAVIDVNEAGTEAAAATFAGMSTLGIERSDEFKVDHPFLFLIRDNGTGTLLFLGRVADPRAM